MGKRFEQTCKSNSNLSSLRIWIQFSRFDCLSVWLSSWLSCRSFVRANINTNINASTNTNTSAHCCSVQFKIKLPPLSLSLSLCKREDCRLLRNDDKTSSKACQAFRSSIHCGRLSTNSSGDWISQRTKVKHSSVVGRVNFKVPYTHRELVAEWVLAQKVN